MLRESAARGDDARADIVHSLNSVGTVEIRDCVNRPDPEKMLRRKFLACAGAVRKISSNFIPETFEARRLEKGAPDCNCLAGLLQGNESGVRRLRDTLDKVRGGLSPRRAALYQARIDREEKLLGQGRVFFDAWCGATQPAATVAAAAPLASPPAVRAPFAALKASVTCFLCSVLPAVVEIEDMIAA